MAGRCLRRESKRLAARMPDIAQQSSERERVAVEAERDTEKLKKCEFMLDKVGEEFEGIISSVTGFGIFVELDNTVEGLIRLSELTDDYYHFHEQHMLLLGERTSKAYRIGDELRIRVERVNMDEHTIDFAIAESKAQSNERAERGRELGLVRAGRGPARGGRGERGGSGRERSGGAARGGERGAKSGEKRGEKRGGGERGAKSGGERSGSAARGGERGAKSGEQRGGERGAGRRRGERGDKGAAGGGARSGASGIAATGPRGRGSEQSSSLRGRKGKPGQNGDTPNADVRGGEAVSSERSGARDARAWKPEDDYNLNRLLGNESEGSGGESGTKPGESELETPRVRKDMWGLPIHGTGGIIDDGEDPDRPSGRNRSGGGGRGRSGGGAGRNGSSRSGGQTGNVNGGARPKKTTEGGVTNAASSNSPADRKKKKSGGNATAAFVRKKQT